MIGENCRCAGFLLPKEAKCKVVQRQVGPKASKNTCIMSPRQDMCLSSTGVWSTSPSPSGKRCSRFRESKAAVDGEWSKSGTILRTGQPGTRRKQSKRRRFDKRKMKEYHVHFACLLWIFATRSMRNLRNISRCTKALRCPEVKDDEGYRAVFVEQSASVSQVASGKISG